MATRGRKPKPTAMKELEGNPGKHPLNTSEPKPNKKAPACPKWLEPEAKKEWRRLAKQMEAIGILTEVDMGFPPYLVLLGATAIVIAAAWLGLAVMQIRIGPGAALAERSVDD